MQKAIIQKYGDLDVIKFIETAAPILTKKQVLVKVKAAALNPKDILVRKGKFKQLTGRKFPQGIGYDFAGTIEDGNGSSFQKGYRVFGMVNGMQGRCCAEFVNVEINELRTMPDALSFEEAAGVPLAGQTALQAIRDKGKLTKGQKICINGASGGVGTLAIQVAKALGGIVTTISSDKNLAFCKSFGADETLAYNQVNILESTDKFDIFFDVFGNYNYQKVAKILTPKGKYVTTVPKVAIFKEQFYNLFRKKKASMVVVKSNTEDLKWFYDKIIEKKIRPVVDKIFPLAEIQNAQKYIESKRAKGKVILTT
ncbi:MAG: NAD(P)-dependent alcohol dehydrogenase [Saprospiraceae bacterium]